MMSALLHDVSQNGMHLPPGCRVVLIPDEPKPVYELFSELPEVCTCKQAADALSIHPATLRELANTGKINGFRVGKTHRFSRKALIDFVEGGGNA